MKQEWCNWLNAIPLNLLKQNWTPVRMWLWREWMSLVFNTLCSIYVTWMYILSSYTHACACCSPLSAPTSWPISSTLPGLTTECPSTPHHWSSLFRKWGRCTATAKHPWWCTAGEGEMHVCILAYRMHDSTLSHHVWMKLHVSYTEQGLFVCFYYIVLVSEYIRI